MQQLGDFLDGLSAHWVLSLDPMTRSLLLLLLMFGFGSLLIMNYLHRRQMRMTQELDARKRENSRAHLLFLHEQRRRQSQWKAH